MSAGSGAHVLVVRKWLEQPPASQYNLPPRWRLIKKVLGDHIRPAQTLQHLSHWSIYWTCLLLSYSNLCWTWWCWAGGWGNNRNDIKHKFHCDPQFFTMLCSASNPPTNIWPSSGLLCRAGFSSIHIVGTECTKYFVYKSIKGSSLGRDSLDQISVWNL